MTEKHRKINMQPTPPPLQPEPNPYAPQDMRPGPRPLQFDRTLTLGLLMTVLIQTGGALMWAGAAQNRLDNLETQVALTSAVAQRLARLEGQSAHMAQSLSRIERELIREAGE